jgi:type VI secretion system protein VasG
MNVNLKSLIGKLNDRTRGAVEAAAGLCLSRTHYDVEIEHFLLKAMDTADGDVALILKHYEVNRSRLATELTASLDRLKSGNARTPTLSPSLVKMLTTAWALGSVDYGANRVRTGHALLALVSEPELRRVLSGVSKELERINPEDLRANLPRILEGSAEEAVGAEASAGSPGGGARPGEGGGKTPNLDQYTVDLTAKAREGRLDPVLGRDIEIRQVVDILMRRRQNNPILVGEAGVGKTAVAEGFAQRVVAGEVPPPLRNVTIRSLDLALLQAGAGVKGEFENRLKGLIEEVKNSPTPVILLIDEAHTMIGAGGTAGQGDAANLLKPALARGELRTIAATTWSEYKKYFEKDPALARRFQLVKVEEPDEEVCMVMMRGIVASLERHHGVRILDDGVVAAVRLSHRYLPDRQLPDKAVTVLDTACARLSLGQNSTPALLEDAMRSLDDLGVQERVLLRETATGSDHGERLELIRNRRTEIEARLDELRARWERERDLVTRVRKVRGQIEDRVAASDGAAAAGGVSTPAANGAGSGGGASEGGGDGGAADAIGTATRGEEAGRGEEGNGEVQAANGEVQAANGEVQADAEALREELLALNLELTELQGESPLIPVTVDAELVGQVISGWTGIPVGKMLRDDLGTALKLETLLQRRIIGQDHALEIISHRIRTSKAGIDDPGKPIGVFLLVGPSGVGKTETALALSDLLYGGEHNVITINMSEFQEAHTVSTLKGSPPGYVGYGEGGVLTEAVRRRPYSVVLLDEIEKAHPDVLELFFQVFDKGRMEDGEGREIDFKNTIILLTTNAGTETIMKLTADPETMPDAEGLAKMLKPELDQVFKPAFLGRTVIIPYFPVRDDVLRQIIRLKLAKIQRRLQETQRIQLHADDAVVNAIADRCTEVESGARNVDNILTNTALPAISRLLLESLVSGVRPASITIGVQDSGEFLYRIDGEGAEVVEPEVVA